MNTFDHTLTAFFITIFLKNHTLTKIQKSEIRATLASIKWPPKIMMILLADKPICSNLHRVVQGVGRDRVSKIVCPVEAHPVPSTFSWTFNSSLETHTVSF